MTPNVLPFNTVFEVGVGNGIGIVGIRFSVVVDLSASVIDVI